MANLTDADKVLRNDTGKDIASKLDDIKSAILGQSTTLNNLSDVSILSVQDGQFLKYDSTEGKWVNVSLPDPMVFKGTLGTSGTITALTVDGSANVGDTYKVIEDGTYSGTSAKVGDLFSCLTKTSIANTWVLIPSGDESFTDTWRGIKVNGTEKLTNSISSGEVDFVAGSNIQISFDTTGNKIIISATDTTYSEATQSTSGLMSASDKTKLDTIPTTADTQPITTGSAVNTKEYIDDKTTFVKSASGSLVHITDGADNIPVKACNITIAPDLSGKTECNLVVCGKNWLPLILADIKTANTSGTWSDNVYTINGAIFTVNTDSNGKVLSIKGKGNGNAGNTINLPFILKAGSYVLNSGFIENNGNNDTFVQSGGVTIARGNSGTPGQTFTLNSDSNCIWFFRMTSNTEIVCKPMIRLESETDATFAPYQATTYNIPFGQTVYGGEGNVTTGEFSVVYAKQTIGANDLVSQYLDTVNGQWLASVVPTTPPKIPESQSTIANAISNIDVKSQAYLFNTTGSAICVMGNGNFRLTFENCATFADMQTYITSNPVTIVYEIATPTSLSLTPVNPKTISGINNIYNDCGATEIEYFTNKSNDILEFVDSEIGKKNGTNIPISASDSTNTKDYIDTKTTLVKSASGSLITITDGGDNIPVKSLVSQIVAVQDLHGYDHPWVGGAGKNLLPLTVDVIKAVNTNGTWNENVYTLNGVTFTILTDNDNNIIGIKVNGTPSSSRSDFYLFNAIDISIFNNNILSGIPTDANGTLFYFSIAMGTNPWTSYPDRGSGVTIGEFASGTLGNAYITVKEGYTVSNVVVYPMIRNSSKSSTFEPYSNICPITGFTEANIVNTQIEEIRELFTIEPSFRGRVNFNQLFTATASGTYDGILTTFDSATGTLHSSGTTASTYYFFVTGTEHKIPITSGHKYFVHIDDTRTVRYAVYDSDTNRNIVDKIGATIINSTYNGWLSLVSMNNTVGSSVDITCKPIVIDLTQMFGTTIADYIYNLEQTQTGAGVAFFKAIYPQEYYPYNVGQDKIVGDITPYTVNLGQTVYGGHFDNKGNLVVTHSFIASYTGETINEPWISSMDNYVPNTLPSLGAQVVYPLTSPITLSITSQDIPTLSGENNIFSDCGSTEIEYFTESADGLAALIKVLSTS